MNYGGAAVRARACISSLMPRRRIAWRLDLRTTRRGAAAGIVRKTTCGRRRLVVKLRATVSSSFIAANRSILAGRALAMPTALLLVVVCRSAPSVVAVRDLNIRSVPL